MPTYDAYEAFRRDFQRLNREEREAFMAAVAKLVEDLRRGVFRKGLRIKRVQTHEGVWEMTWAPDGRVTFEYGPAIHPGEHHVIWRRIGGHEIFDNP
jgi:hypothetical protein